MLILALDTTTRAGSVALARDGELIAWRAGDPRRTHGERLPGEIHELLAPHGVALAAIDTYAVARGPGSFTGLRVGLATIQGLALVNRRPVVPVSALDALAHADPQASEATLVAAWIDAQRGEVFSGLYQRRAGSLEELEGPAVDGPARTLARWHRLIDRPSRGPVRFVGDGALRYATAIAEALGPHASIADPVPPLAPVIARLAWAGACAGGAVHPAAIQPLYVRRPDAELARERGT